VRVNPYNVIDSLIRHDYRLPIFKEAGGAKSGESFITVEDNSVRVGELFQVMKTEFLKMEKKLKTYEKYHKAASKIKNTQPRNEWQEGCRDTFGAGFFLEYDEYKDFREIYWEIEEVLK